jgi:hypothetical protein
MRSICLAAVLLLATPGLLAAGTLPAPASRPCLEQPRGRALDFWVGDWKVVNAADGTAAGENRIERLLDGCAVTETWHGVEKGDDGMSLFTYDARRHVWDQVWVTQDTSRPGGLKHKTMTGILYANAVQFQGAIATPKGQVLDRTTLTPWRDGRVRQTIEWSKDGGKAWRVVFDAFYIRKGSPNPGASPFGDPH